MVGNYELEIRYKKDVFDTEYREYILPISIEAPWYLSWFSLATYTLILMIIVYYGVRLIKRHQRREKLVKELMLHEKLNATFHAMPYHLHDILVPMSDMFKTCSELRQKPSMNDDYYQSIDRLYEGLLSFDFQFCNKWKDGAVLDHPYEVIEWQMKRTNLKELSNDIVRALIGKGIKQLSSLEISIPDDLYANVPINLMKYLLYYLYRAVALSTEKINISFHQSSNLLQVQLTYPDEMCKEVSDIIDKLKKGEDTSHEQRFYTSLYRAAAKNAGVKLNALKNTIVLDVPTVTESSNLSKEKEINRSCVLLLESNMELSCLIKNMLEPQYEVHIVETIQSAFTFLRNNKPKVFMADSIMYIKEEEKFFEYIEVNKGLLTNIPFIPLVSWKSSYLLNRQSPTHKWGFVILPYNLQFVKDVVDYAIYWSSSTKPTNKGTAYPTFDSAPNQKKEEENDSLFAKQLKDIIDNNLDKEDLSPAFIAELLNMSTRQYYRKLKDVSNLTSSEFIKNYRLERAAEMLIETDATIQEIIEKVGFQSRSYFYKEFGNRYGLTPKAYQQAHRKTNKDKE